MALWKDKTRGDWLYDFQYQKQRYSNRGYKTKKEAAKALAERREEVKRMPSPTHMTFLEVCNYYLKYSEKKHVTKTFKGKKTVIRSFLAFLKDQKAVIGIQEITPILLSSYLDTRPTNNSYNVYRKELSSIFEYAKRTLEVVERNPINKIDRLPHDTKRKTVPPEDVVIKLILAADPKTDEKDLLMVLLHTLARIDEVLRLTWADVNFEKRILTKKTKKTKDSTYKDINVTINNELYDTLWCMWEARQQNTWVFYNKGTGTRYMHRPKFMQGLCLRAGIVPHFGFHTLRHLMASLLADNPKVATKTIQKILGHSNIKTTEIYVHSIEGAVEDAMDSLSGVFSHKMNAPKKSEEAS